MASLSFIAESVAVLSAAALQQVDLYEQYTKVLQRLEQQSPLLLVIDDLQWADAGTINLLFHLGRRLGGQRILILGAYRPSDVARGRDGQRHPLDPVVGEFRRTWGEITVDLAEAEGRGLVDRLVREFPRFNDVSRHRGREVRIYKLAQLAFWVLHCTLRRHGGFRIDDLASMTAFAD